MLNLLDVEHYCLAAAVVLAVGDWILVSGLIEPYPRTLRFITKPGTMIALISAVIVFASRQPHLVCTV